MSNLAITSESVMDLDPNKEPTRFGRPVSLHTEVIQSRWKWITELTGALDNQERELFEFTYGRISYLPLMHVEFPLLQALVAFWNTDFHCFTFEMGDIAPTMGEYEALLDFPSKRNMRPYRPRPDRISRRQLTNWLEWDEKDFTTLCKSCNQIEGLEVGYFENYYGKMVEREGRKSERVRRWKIRLLAVGIYGLILLPQLSNFISIDVLELLYRVENEDISPVMPILAETYAALTLNALKKARRLACSTHLLHLWAISQLFKREALPVLAQRSVSSGVIAIFCNFVAPQKTHGQWRNELLCLKDINFRPLWYSRLGQHYELKLERRGYLVLMDLWHMVSYAPSMLARQFCDKQGHPHLTNCDYLQTYRVEEDWQLIEKITAEWQNELVMGVSGKGVSAPLSVYWHWRNSTGTGKFRAPMGWFSDKKGPIKQPVEIPGKKSVVQLQEETIVGMSKELETLRLESAEWKKKWEEANERNLDLSKRLCYQNEMIDDLHEQLNQASREVKRAKGKGKQENRKADAHALKEIARLEKGIQDLRQGHKQEAKRWENDFNSMKGEMEIWKQVAQREANARMVIRDEFMMMANDYNSLSDEYKTKSVIMLRKGEELILKINEAQQQLSDITVEAMSEGNEEIANRLQQVYQLLASCHGECSHARVEGPLPEVPTELHSSEHMPGSVDPMVEDDSLLSKINEEPGDFEEM